MKKFRIFTAFILLFAFVFSFSGCSFRLTSIENLIRPPRLSGEYQGLQDAFEKSVKTPVSLKAPENGSYQSAVVTFDADKNGAEEAIIFYTADDKKSDTVTFSMFKFDEKEWCPAGVYEGLGTSVDRVFFFDVDGDGVEEIVIGWNLFTSSTNKIFAVYKIISSGLEYMSSFQYSYIGLLDVNGDGLQNLFTLTVDSSISESPTAYARLYKYDKEQNEIFVWGEAETDGNISAYSSVFSETVDDVNLIYVEAKKGEREAITEVLYWDQESNVLLSPLFDAASRTTKLTWRNNGLQCTDIDSDGFYEIPASVEMKASSITSASNFAAKGSANAENNTASLYFTKWVKFRDNRLKPVQYSVYNKTLGYLLNIPSSWVGRITVVGNEGQWDFYRLDSQHSTIGDLLFSIYSYNKTDSKLKEEYSIYNQLSSNSSNAFVYMITDEGRSFGVTDETIKDGFVLK